MNPFIQQLLNAAKNTAGKVARNLEVQALRKMGPSTRRATGLSSYSIGPITAATKQDPSLLRALPSVALAGPGTKTSLGLATIPLVTGTADRTGLTGAIESGLNQVGPGLDRFFGAVIPKGVQDFGKSMEQYGWGALGGIVPGEAGSAPISRPLNAIDTGKYGPTDWNPSANPRRVPTASAPSSGAADRAYQQELSRTAQMTAQDPELQRYETARAAAKTQAEMNSVRDIGMEMWAKANPALAAKVQPGQSGFDAIYKQTGQVPAPTFNPLMERTFPGMSRGAGEYTMGPSPLVPQVDPALNPAGPTYALGEGPRLMNFSDEKVTPEIIKAYQEQLLKQAASK